MSVRRSQFPWSSGTFEPDAPARGDWYAVTEDGASAVRLTQSLTLGERGDGELALNGGPAEARWVTFDLAADGGAVVACPAGRLLDDAGRPLARQPLEPGLCLALPNNRVRISRSIQNPAAEGPVVSVRRAGQDADGATTPSASAPATEPGAQDPAASILRVEEPATPVSQPGSRVSDTGRVGMPPWRSVLVAGVALGLLLMVLLVAVPVPAPSVAPAPERGQDPQGVAAAPAAATAAAAVDPAESVPAEGATEPDPPVAPPVTPVRLPAVAVRMLPVPRPGPPDPRLARAETLIEANKITFPPGNNAVALLTAVLRDHPGHPEAMNLLGRCTDRLLDAAREARAAGRDYEARNVLEELLGFNPEHPEARALWSDWMAAPD